MAKSTDSPHWALYLRWMITTAFIIVAAVGVFNIVINPLGVFDSPRINGLNAIKPYLDHHRELARWQAARRLCPNAGIFGNSRAEIGFDPENPIFSEHGLSAFNHAIPGSSLSLAFRQVGWLKSAGCMPNVVILGVEFFDFLGGSLPDPRPVQEGSTAPKIDARFFAESVFSIAGLRDSLGTVALQQSRYPAVLTERGFNPLLNYIPEVEQNGHYTLFRQRVEENARNWRRKAMRLHPLGEGASDDERIFEAILEELSPKQPSTYIVIYPYHAQIRVMIERLGLGGLFSEWKRLIVSIAMRRAEKGDKIQVWDFSGLSPQTLEPIPSRGDRHTHLNYYWEAGHFKKALGDRILSRLLAQEGDFGVQLDNRNIDHWLSEDRQMIHALFITAPPWIGEVDAILAEKIKK